MELELRRISVVGLGKLGLPLAACFAWKGFPAIGLDVNYLKIQSINQRVSPIYEPRLQEIMAASGGRLIATDDYEKMVMNSDFTFILVPTPVDKQNNFSLQYVLETARHIGKVIGKKSAYHSVVLTSTVMPGSTQNQVKPLLEENSGKRCGKDFGLCYNPEFVALGSVIHDLLNPDFILIGESDTHCGGLLAGLYRRFCDNSPPVARMNFVNAELTKLAVNTYVTTKITFANALAHICERLPGADVDVVTSALGLDSRIGRKYLKGAIGYGGPCFPRDKLALAAFARSIGLSATLAETTDFLNRKEVERLGEIVKRYLPRNGKVGILGLSYKANSDVVEESQGIFMAENLVKHGISVVVYDPVAMENARLVLKESVTFAASARDCVNTCDVIIIVTAWDEFRQLPLKMMSRQPQPRVLVDCWRIFEKAPPEEGIIYVPLGIGA